MYCESVPTYIPLTRTSHYDGKYESKMSNMGGRNPLS